MMNKVLQQFPAEEILQFWFGDAVKVPSELSVQAKKWFTGGPEMDQDIMRRFGHLFDEIKLVDAETYQNPEQLLAAVILFDQFSRNCFRGKAKAFDYDAFSLDLLDYALVEGWDEQLHPLQRAFLYMPLQHIESKDGQALGVKYFQALADSAPEGYESMLKGNADYAVEHYELIARFGRFPHRNEALRRPNTDSEQEYLDSGGKRFGQ